jgi:hypothetical protein
VRILGATLFLAAILASCGGGGDTPTDVEKESECDDRGINPERGRTGTCLQGGYKLTVVNRGDLLQLEDWTLKLNDYATAKTLGEGSGEVARADGTFVVFGLTVTNRQDRPVTFDDNQDQMTLSLGDNTFRQSFEAASGPVVDSCLTKKPALIPAGTSKTCKIAFDVPTKAAESLTSRKAVGNLNFFATVVETGDAEKARVGTIRLYR